MLYSEPRQIRTVLQEDGTLKSSPISIEEVIRKVNDTPHDISISQERLDLANKFRTSLFPWRGQFSPELVEILLDRYSQPETVILDPFVGSGTTLFEAARKNFRCYGVEINPSAFEMAKTAQFANIALADRKAVIRNVESLVEKFLLPFRIDLFSYQIENYRETLDFNSAQDEVFRTLVQETNKDPFVQNFIINVIIRYMGYRSPHTQKDFFRALQEHAKIVEGIPYSKVECKVFHCDARSIPLEDNSIDLIITSPPYINVFNYHQNNRPAMELIGWDLLNIAKSEIGSNRKNRQNRFLTVIQYALDMLDALVEMKRLLKPNGRAIIVVGKESSVRGASFKNGILVASLAIGGAGFHLEAIQKRKFVNKFGETIYEDILHLVPGSSSLFNKSDIARSIAIWSLDQAATSDEQIKLEIQDAKKRAAGVQKSPLFNIPATPYQNIISPGKNKIFEERGAYMITYPTPHLEKLEATLTNDKLPQRDRPHVEEAVQHYKQWVAEMDSIMGSAEPVSVLLEKMVSLLNQYRIRMDIELIFNSQDDRLYRQKGQLKLDNSIIEEFLPRLIHPSIIPELGQMDVNVGPIGAFAATWFDSSLIKPEVAGGFKIRSKDQDFAISKPLYLKASHFSDFRDSAEQVTNLAYIAAECKTNLDKTMFQEACATARDLKTAIPSAKYFLLCEWLDMKPISSTTTPIDETLILRKAKRISSNIRSSFSTFEGRQAAMSSYIDYLNEHPYRVEIFKRFIDSIQRLLKVEVLDEDTVLDRGYF